MSADFPLPAGIPSTLHRTTSSSGYDDGDRASGNAALPAKLAHDRREEGRNTIPALTQSKVTSFSATMIQP
ncbi:hypothetical protein H8B02_13700 [Bradyrhizobium sp. Pear77]|uniref:hypothetical protein n=1 Tax=Bradyrhizobium altum TaxID=1571202 RepID=UPI001E2EA171|nr:hypothetical protein [Bradyrhizobium altum]MCC8954461.1 hypothetical protein [Bradyrhizobium altum]